MSGGGIAGNTASGVEVLLRILDNPKEYKTKLEQFSAAAKNADELISLAAPASEIIQIRGQLKKEREALTALWAEAERRRDTMLIEAKKEADKSILAASQKAVEIRAEAEQKMKQAQDKMNLAESKKSEAEANLKQRELELKNLRRETEAAAEQKELLRRQTLALATEQERLRGARESLAAALG